MQAFNDCLLIAFGVLCCIPYRLKGKPRMTEVAIGCFLIVCGIIGLFLL